MHFFFAYEFLGFFDSKIIMKAFETKSIAPAVNPKQLSHYIPVDFFIIGACSPYYSTPKALNTASSALL